MAAVLLSTNTDFGFPVVYLIQGLSTDAMPTTLPDGSALTNGSTYHVLDTGAQFVFHQGDWLPDLRTVYAIKLAAAL
jgi:hypothetical protein